MQAAIVWINTLQMYMIPHMYAYIPFVIFIMMHMGGVCVYRERRSKYNINNM